MGLSLACRYTNLDGLVDVFGTNQVCSAPLFCALKLAFININANDAPGSRFMQCIDDCETYCAQTEYCGCGALLHLGTCNRGLNGSACEV